MPIQNTDLDVRIFRLCHTCPFLSSAFLVSRRHTSATILYLGDTGPDDVEKIPLPNNQTYSPRYLDRMWQDVAPLVASEQLKAIFIEVSYANGRPDHLLFGHLTPDWLLKELRVLSSYSPMKQVKIIVTHIKPDKEAKTKIRQQLTKDTEQEFSFIFPEQGEPIWLWSVFQFCIAIKSTIKKCAHMIRLYPVVLGEQTGKSVSSIRCIWWMSVCVAFRS